MKRILLVSPLPVGFELTQDDTYLKLPFTKTKRFMMPLHIATIAGLTSDDFEVDLWDEALHGRINDDTDMKDYDLVGMTGFIGHLERAKEIAAVFRKRRVLTAVGGPGVSSQPHVYRKDFDHIFIGEAELIWPRFLEDWKKGEQKPIYRQIGQVDLALTPVPRWDSIAHQVDQYRLGAVQTSRGCPFDCDFCDVSLLFGSRYRSKPIDKVLQEVSNLEKLGAGVVVFCDDNFIGNPGYAKQLLKELIPLNNSFRQPLGFGSEMSLNLAKDEELLELLADANFREIFIGIESINKDSLRETHKLQNVQSNIAEDIKKIQSYGLPIRGSLIVGFDHDGKEIFDETFRFAQESCLALPSIRVLMAPPGTRLWKRLQNEGRLLKTTKEGRFFGNPGTTNILPKKMSRIELHAGFLELRDKLYDWENFSARVKGLISNVKRQPQTPPQKKNWKFVFQFTCFFFSPLLDNKTRRVILSILDHTRRHASFMLPTVARGILRQFGYAYVNTHKLRESVQDQIDLEKAGQVTLEIEKSEPLIPEDFTGLYKEIFPEIRDEVARGLHDQSGMEEALIEIFSTFLRQWKDQSKAYSEDHRESLTHLAAEIVTSRNQKGNGSAVVIGLTGDLETGIKIKSLSDEILKAVGQELLISQ